MAAAPQLPGVDAMCCEDRCPIPTMCEGANRCAIAELRAAGLLVGTFRQLQKNFEERG